MAYILLRVQGNVTKTERKEQEDEEACMCY